MKHSHCLAGALALALATVAATPVAAEKFYKWTDDQGVTHYGSEPPQGAEGSEVRTDAASSSQQRELERLKERREADRQASQRAEEQEREQRRLKEEPDAVAQERCEQHRKNLETLENKPTVRQENPDTGEMEVIDQDRRESMLEQTRQALEDC